jgi:hypothetical protein
MDEHPPMDYSGKRTDVVDAGGEFDYSGIQWFTDPPERPPVRLIISFSFVCQLLMLKILITSPHPFNNPPRLIFLLPM